MGDSPHTDVDFDHLVSERNHLRGRLAYVEIERDGLHRALNRVEESIEALLAEASADGH